MESPDSRYLTHSDAFMNSKGSPRERLSFLQLPKELRLLIYELALQHHKQIKIGSRDYNDERLSPWPLQPGICRACKLTRAESLQLHYSTVSLWLNIQRPSGELMVLTWLDRMSATSPDALRAIVNVKLVTGLGAFEPPKEYMIDMQRNSLWRALRPCAISYMYRRHSHPRNWTALVCGALKRRLRQLPDGTSPGFDLVNNLREVMALVGELSGYGASPDFLPVQSLIRDVHPKVLVHTGPPSLLLDLPKELRLLIFEHALTTEVPVTVGQRASILNNASDGPTYPDLTRVCSSIRTEVLPIYFACTHFVFNIQREQCEDFVTDWIHRSSRTYPSAFQCIQYVSVVAGSGISQPPRQYEFLIQQSIFTSVIGRPISQPYTLSPSRWNPPPLEEVQESLQQLPKRGEPQFDAASNLLAIIRCLATYCS